MTESLTLKWGTIKGWDLQNEKTQAIMRRYIDTGMSMSTMSQRDTPEQKDIICELIDALDCETIYLDWDGKDVTKEEAKKYIREYGQKSAAA